ncbi:unnamed protein product [Urochloa humidicola]
MVESSTAAQLDGGDMRRDHPSPFASELPSPQAPAPTPNPPPNSRGHSRGRAGQRRHRRPTSGCWTPPLSFSAEGVGTTSGRAPAAPALSTPLPLGTDPWRWGADASLVNESMEEGDGSRLHCSVVPALPHQMYHGWSTLLRIMNALTLVPRCYHKRRRSSRTSTGSATSTPEASPG